MGARGGEGGSERSSSDAGLRQLLRPSNTRGGTKPPPPWGSRPPENAGMVEESAGGAARGARRGPCRPPPAPSPKRLWSVERSGRGWRLERPVGVDCSSPEPRCIWLSSLRRHLAAPDPRPPPGPRGLRTERSRRVRTGMGAVREGLGGVGVPSIPWGCVGTNPALFCPKGTGDPRCVPSVSPRVTRDGGARRNWGDPDVTGWRVWECRAEDAAAGARQEPSGRG